MVKYFFNKRLVDKLVRLSFEEWETYKEYGADILNGLDLAMYDLFPNEDDEPEGLYDHVAEILKGLMKHVK